jgi:hypothetical protein
MAIIITFQEFHVYAIYFSTGFDTLISGIHKDIMGLSGEGFTENTEDMAGITWITEHMCPGS